MAPSDPRQDLEGLLVGSRWVRALARGLVRDSASAEDLVQDTWVVALSRPASAGDPRAWLAGVVRHLARREARSNERRRKRETAQARCEALPSTDELVERSELLERLSAAVRALDEPYRTTLLLHYAEGLSLEEIARSQHVPSSTTRTRLSRGLERLRARLDAEHDGRAKWLAALAPLAGAPSLPFAPTAATVTLGSLAMGAKTGLGLAAVAVGAAVLAISIALREPGTTQPPAAPGPAETALALAGGQPEASGEPRQESDSEGRRPAEGTTGEAPSPTALLLFGALVTMDGEEVPEASLTLWNDEGERGEATVAPGSWSIVGLAPGAWNVSVRARGFYPLHEELTLRGEVPETRHDLVLEPARVLRIRFVDAAGETVIGADTRFHPLLPGLGAVATLAPPGPRIPGVDGRMPDRSEAGQYLSPLTYSRVDGLPPDCAGLLALTRPPPVYVSAVLRDVVLETRLDNGIGEEMVFVLDEQALRANLAGLTLRLVDARTGAVLQGTATLSFRDGGGRSASTDDEGSLRFEEQIPGLRRLEVSARDHARLVRVLRLEPGRKLDLGVIALTPARSLEGWLLDEDGSALAQRFSCVSGGQVASPLYLENAVGALVHGDGHFELWNLGAGEPLLLLRHENYAANPLRLDTDAEGRTRAIARRGTPVLLRPHREPRPELRYAIADAAGHPFWTRRVYDQAPIRLRLVPGRYQLLEGHDEVFTVVRTFEVGSEPVVLAP